MPTFSANDPESSSSASTSDSSLLGFHTPLSSPTTLVNTPNRTPSPMVTDDAITKLEERVSASEGLLNAINSQLKLLLEHSQLPPPPVNTHSSPPTTSAKPALPTPFNGDKKTGFTFLNAIKYYLRLRPSEFPDKRSKVDWAMSWMSGHESVIRWRDQLEKQRGYCWALTPPTDYITDFAYLEAIFTE